MPVFAVVETPYAGGVRLVGTIRRDGNSSVEKHKNDEWKRKTE